MGELSRLGVPLPTRSVPGSASLLDVGEQLLQVQAATGDATAQAWLESVCEWLASAVFALHTGGRGAMDRPRVPQPARTSLIDRLEGADVASCSAAAATLLAVGDALRARSDVDGGDVADSLTDVGAALQAVATSTAAARSDWARRHDSRSPAMLALGRAHSELVGACRGAIRPTRHRTSNH